MRGQSKLIGPLPQYCELLWKQSISVLTAAEAEKRSGRKPARWKKLASPWYPCLTSFLKLILWNESEKKYRFSITEMQKNFSELNLVIWIDFYNPQELLITNTTLFHIVERNRLLFFLNIIIFLLLLLFLYKNILEDHCLLFLLFGVFFSNLSFLPADDQTSIRSNCLDRSPYLRSKYTTWQRGDQIEICDFNQDSWLWRNFLSTHLLTRGSHLNESEDI